MKIEENEKFALIAFPNVNVDSRLAETIELEHGFFACRKLPGKVAEHWNEWLGFQAEHVQNSDLYIGCKAASLTPDILDIENQILEKRTVALYWGILLSGCIRAHEAPIALTGVVQKGEFNIRSVSAKQRPKFIVGTPLLPGITAARLISASHLAASIESLYADPNFRRFKRVFGAFQAGIDEHLGDVRLHQFVRCVEGFVLPRPQGTKRDVQHRTKVFIGHKHEALVGQLYDLRSKAEHLHDVFELFSDLSKAEQFERLFRRTFEAECLARLCMMRFLTTPTLWPHFVNDKTLESFWNLDQGEQQRIWGKTIDFTAAINKFETNDIQTADFLEEEE